MSLLLVFKFGFSDNEGTGLPLIFYGTGNQSPPYLPLIFRGYGVQPYTTIPVDYEVILDILNLPLQINNPRIKSTILSSLSTTKYLRYDDVALNKFLERQFVRSKIEHFDILDGFPENEPLVVPSLVIEHDKTYEDPLELGKKNSMQREYYIDIFARTKGQLDEASLFLESLDGREFITDDDRVNTIVGINSLNENLHNLISSKLHNNFYFIRFNQPNTYGYIPMTNNDFNIKSFSIDLDINIRNLGNSDITIVDKYISDDLTGFIVYITSSGILHFKCGFNLNNFDTTYNISNYIGQRIQLSLSASLTGTKIKHRILINGNIVKSVDAITTTTFIMGNKDITIGAYVDNYTLTPYSYSNFADIDLYGFRFSNEFSTEFDKTNQYLNQSIGHDLIYCSCNEGYGHFAYDKSRKLLNNINLSGNYTWELYLNEIFKNTGYKHRRYLIKTDSIKNLVLN